jgi:hypothetical protein
MPPLNKGDDQAIVTSCRLLAARDSIYRPNQVSRDIQAFMGPGNNEEFSG